MMVMIAFIKEETMLFARNIASEDMCGIKGC